MPRHSLGLEIALSLGVKLAALLAIGLTLFGPGDRVHPSADTAGAAIVGDGMVRNGG